ncbi:hypothetical protein ACFQWB_10275 [Paenibacillus thermoaerophilus]|uniref:Uncharacterized protein n=1 Tax=Paenibacillus thermoaerophilus TaxID=1215385 RepID=A0ABW2V2D7_9BACL|nr:hypothetical protein [Paenibacillus thermoaerophilus]
MKRLWVKKWISGCMAFGLMLSAVLPAGAGHAAAADPQAAPELFVTEIGIEFERLYVY